MWTTRTAGSACPSWADAGPGRGFGRKRGLAAAGLPVRLMPAPGRGGELTDAVDHSCRWTTAAGRRDGRHRRWGGERGGQGGEGGREDGRGGRGGGVPGAAGTGPAGRGERRPGCPGGGWGEAAVSGRAGGRAGAAGGFGAVRCRVPGPA